MSTARSRIACEVASVPDQPDREKLMDFRRIAALVLIMLTATFVAGASDDLDPITFGGEDYKVAHKDARDGGNSLVELVRDGDKLESWHKLIAFHRFPNSGDSPKDAALGLAALLKQRDPATRFAIVENPKTREVIIDFLASEKGTDQVELNVFKYARHHSKKGLVAIQFAERFRLGEANGEGVKKSRQTAIDETAGFDIELADPYLRGGNSDDDEADDLPARD